MKARPHETPPTHLHGHFKPHDIDVSHKIIFEIFVKVKRMIAILGKHGTRRDTGQDQYVTMI